MFVFFLQKEPTPGIKKEYEYNQFLMPGITLTEINAVAKPIKQNETTLTAKAKWLKERYDSALAANAFLKSHAIVLFVLIAVLSA